MTTLGDGHIPVLLQEVLRVLAPERGGRFLDATFGGGGHTRALLDAGADTQVIAFDQDPEAATRADAFAATYGERFRLIAENFSRIADLDGLFFDGILFDLGVSSFQLDDLARGFSFRGSAATDMRMDTRTGQTAAAFLETASYTDLVHAIRNLGEETSWRRVVDAIMAARGTGKLQDTATLAELIEAAIPKRPGKPSRIHPATLSFQGIRMAVNQELETLEAALPAAFERLAPGGALVVIAFHSLEDRIVKRFSRRMAGRPEHRGDATVQDERTVRATLLNSRPVTATEAEIAANPRSRSAKLRALRKLP